MSDIDPPTEGRSLVLEQEVPAPPEEVWQALTTGEGLRRWFPLDARVEGGVGGSVWLSWGPGVEGQAPIHVWDEPRHFGWSESHGEDESGRPIRIAVDFYVEAREGTTVVRLVQSGFSASSEWDQMFDALKDGWTYFLFNLAYYFLKHRGKPRKVVWRRVATDLAKDAVWERLLAGALVGAAAGPAVDVRVDLEPRAAEVASLREGRYFAAAIPSLEDSLYFVELEGQHVGFWLSTYALEDDRVQALQAALDARVDEVLG